MTNEEALSITREELKAKIDSYQTKEIKVRVIPMEEPKVYLPKEVKKKKPRQGRVRNARPIKTEQPHLDTILQNKLRREGLSPK